ncbi:MAG: hypothetical protein HKP14_07460 [Bacteroidia bacterium]|nr:hypothetical protein [Bacteroidia bacterium]
MRLLRDTLAILIAASCFLGGCKDEPETPTLVLEGNDVLISNEGNFGWGEGSLSLYNPTTKSVQNDVFRTKNGQGIGNVFQSISYHNNQYFFVVNNSNKIVLTSDSFQQTNEIIGLTSPRYFYKVADHKAYVTDLYSKSISVVDMKSLTVSSEIEMNGWTEKGVIVNNEFWVVNVESKYIYIIDIASDAVTDSIEVRFAPESIIQDSNGTIWILSKGDEVNSKQPSLAAVNAVNKKFIKEITLNGLPTNLIYDEQLNQMYFLNSGIYSMPADTASRPEVWLESNNNNNFYGLGVNPSNNEVYVSDIHDFVQKSTIYRYSSQANLLDEFKTGIIAGNFFFHQK